MGLYMRLMSGLIVCCLVVVLVTGAILAFFHSPVDDPIIYDGAYEPLRGVEMSSAYASRLDLAFEAPGGLLAAHLWSALALLLVVVLRVVFTRRLLQVLPVLALLGLGAPNAVVGLMVAGALPGWEVVEQVPAVWWYGVHLLLALVTAAVVVVSVVYGRSRG